jgi:hypothetical protein
MDAFDMARTMAPDVLERSLRRAVPLDDFVIGELFAAAPAHDSNSRLAFLQRVYEFLEGAVSEVQAATLVRKAAVLCGLAPEEAVTDFMNRRNGRRAVPVQPLRTEKVAGSADRVIRRQDFEQYLLRLAFAFPEACEELAGILQSGFLQLEDSQAMALAAVLYPADGPSASPELRVSDPAWKAVLEEDRLSKRLGDDWLVPFSDTMRSIRVMRLRRQRKELADEVRRASLSGDRQAVADMQRRLLESRQAEEHLIKAQETRWWRHG